MHKSSEVLENTFLYISVLNWPQLALKVFLNNSLDNWNLQLYYPYVIDLKEYSCLIMFKGIVIAG